MERPLKVFCLLLVLALAISVRGCTSSTTATKTGINATGSESSTAASPGIDPQSEQLLQQLGATMQQAKAVRVSEHAVWDELQNTGQTVQLSRRATLVAAHPDQLFVTAKGDDGTDWAAWYDGRVLTLLDRVNNEYATEEFRGTNMAMLGHMHDKYGMDFPMGDFMTERLYESTRSNIQEAFYLGKATVAGREARHLLCKQEQLDWQLWVTPGEKPLPLKLVITFKQKPGQPGFTANFDRWELDPVVPDDVFKFTAPSGAKKVEVADLLREEKEEGGEQ
jgi:hypothetical protein